MNSRKILLGVLLSLPISIATANETNKYFGDRSWQWKSPTDKALDNQRLMIRCAAKPKNCAGLGNSGGAGGAGGNGAGLGFGLASGQNIGNIINVIVTGDNNVVTIDSDQVNHGDQTVDIDVNDNELDITIDDHSQVITGDNANNNNPIHTTDVITPVKP